MINELDGHGRDVESGDGVPHDHHLDVLVAESLWTPASRSLLRKKAVE